MGNSESATTENQPTTLGVPQYDIVQKVHNPHYGDVKVIRDQRTNELMILKEVVVNTREAFENELSFFEKRVTVSHPNVVRLFGHTTQDAQNFCSTFFKISVFIEVLSKNLEADIQEHITDNQLFSETEILALAENLISGLSFFQTLNLSHGDIRPFNILLSTDGDFKLSDPYLHPLRTNGLANAIIGNAQSYLAPELISQVPEQDFEIKGDRFKADVYSLGITLLGFASLTRSEDLYDYENGTINKDLLEERLKIVQGRYSTFTYELIRDMLNNSEEERPDFVALANRLLPYQDEIRKRAALHRQAKEERSEASGHQSRAVDVIEFDRQPSYGEAEKKAGVRSSAPTTEDGFSFTPYYYNPKTPAMEGLEDLNARIKEALLRTQETIRKVFGEHYNIPYSNSAVGFHRTNSGGYQTYTSSRVFDSNVQVEQKTYQPEVQPKIEEVRAEPISQPQELPKETVVEQKPIESEPIVEQKPIESEPIVEQKSEEPVKQEEVQEPVKQEEIQEPIKQEEIQEPVKQEEVQEPVKQEEEAQENKEVAQDEAEKTETA